MAATSTNTKTYKTYSRLSKYDKKERRPHRLTTNSSHDPPLDRADLPVVGRETLFLLVQEAWERGTPFDLRGVRLLETDLLSGRFFNLDLSGVRAEGYRFGHPQGRSLFPRVCFRDAHLDGADFRSCRLLACSFRAAHLSCATFAYAIFEANMPLGFLYAEMAGADLSYARMEGADLRGINAPHLMARRAHLAYSDLRGANLAGADLTGANLTCCDFERANLSGALLTAAVIEGADFTHTRLEGTGLERVQQQRGNGHTYTFVGWRHKDTTLPAPIPPLVLNHPYNRDYPVAPPVLSEEEMSAAYKEYGRYYEEHGLHEVTSPDFEEEEESIYHEGEAQPPPLTQWPAPTDPYLPDFPDD